MSDTTNNVRVVMDQLPGADIAGKSPLHHADLATVAAQGPQTGGVCIQEMALQGLLTLRCNAGDAKQVKAVKKLLGVDLPTQPLSCGEADGTVIRWMSPDEWLISMDSSKVFDIESAFNDDMPGHYALVNVSGGLTTLMVSGEHAVDVMKKSVSMDFHLSVFPVGKVVSTVMAKSSATIRRTAEDSFELTIRRSFADYLWLWLQDASREYGLCIKA
jgi:sarcosine oxidase subunit gamma